MKLILGNLLLYLALGPCFKSTDAQETTTETETDENITITLQNKNIVEPTLSSEILSATSENTATLQTDLHNTETTAINKINTMSEETTGGSTPPSITEVELTSLESVPETTPGQTEPITVSTYLLPVNVETTVITLGAPSTIQHETTVSFTSPEPTSPTEGPTDEITAADAMTTESTEALHPTSILTTPPADETESTSIISMSDPVDTITESSTTSTSTTLFPENTANYPESESVSTLFTTTPTMIIGESTMPFKNNWLLIIIVFVAIIFSLCVGAILFAQRRKKNTARNFSPMYMNGQSKRSKKKKGMEDDAWAGPVNLEAGLECDGEVQEGFLPNNGKPDGDDMVLSTFVALDAGEESNGGVGGDGTKEAKKWEEQEPLLYIDEDVNEGKPETTPEESEGQKGKEKSEEKGMNGGETFCLTTAV
ncbi:zonadhesin [Puntigrus tetrazona]|uniref:zonadhesin n=1 Tax=Puntigrus tetrazona TaxID=1606681 RepID=UPI001C8A922C|nr:zonadhesin [Puntigrus tetrazona]